MPQPISEAVSYSAASNGGAAQHNSRGKGEVSTTSLLHPKFKERGHWTESLKVQPSSIYGKEAGWLTILKEPWTLPQMVLSKPRRHTYSSFQPNGGLRALLVSQHQFQVKSCDYK